MSATTRYRLLASIANERPPIGEQAARALDEIDLLCDRIDTLTAQVATAEQLSCGCRPVNIASCKDRLMAERDTLTAENAKLKAANGSPVEGGYYFWNGREYMPFSIEVDYSEGQALTSKALADLRELRAAVARVADATSGHIIGDEPWRAAFKALLALVPLDGSWETEQ